MRTSYVGVLFNTGVSRIEHLRTGGVVGLYARAMSSALRRAVLLPLSVIHIVTVCCERVSL